MATNNLPFAGIKVLDLTAHRAGPTSVRMLSDWGADTIKIEQPAAINNDKMSDLGSRNGFDMQNLHRNKRATTIDPEILVLDEGLSAGDARFAESAKRRVESLIDRTSILILASHSDALISQMCNRALLLSHGKVIADGKPAEVIAEYKAMVAAESAIPPPAPPPPAVT